MTVFSFDIAERAPEPVEQQVFCPVPGCGNPTNFDYVEIEHIDTRGLRIPGTLHEQREYCKICGWVGEK